MNDESERRRDARHETNERMFVQIVACNESALVGTTVSGEALDISASGLKIETGANIPDGCRLDIWVDIAEDGLNGNEERYSLSTPSLGVR